MNVVHHWDQIQSLVVQRWMQGNPGNYQALLQTLNLLLQGLIQLSYEQVDTYLNGMVTLVRVMISHNAYMYKCQESLFQVLIQ